MNVNETDFSKLSVEDLYLWVKKKAYQLYISRERGKGSDWQDWFEAEKQLVREILRK